MKRVLLPVIFLAGCSGFGISDADLAPPEGMLRPMPRPEAGADAPPAGANTVEALDTSSAAERAAALAAGEPAAQTRLGTTIATLGNPADPGFWLQTPLVDRVRQGRVESANGGTVKLELRPIESAPGAGSRISLAALRLLNVGLTGLHELMVYAD